MAYILHGKYYEFYIYEPKERLIKALPYRDRVVHQWYIQEFIKPYIVPKFISTSYACIEERGMHKAANNVQHDMRVFKRNYGDFWILKCDIKKFFYNINIDILYKLISRNFKSKELLDLTKRILFDGSSNENIGLSIGNYTSQYFANIYLNELDKFVKETLKIKYYTRYMDDFILLLPTKKDCWKTKNKIQEFLAKNLQLELNEKSRYYPYNMGVDFCGYRIFTTHRLLRKSNKKLIKSKVKIWNKLYLQNHLDILKAARGVNSWIAHSSHCNSYKLQKKIINDCEFIYK